MSEILDLSGRVIATSNPETGELVRAGKNPEYCSIRVQSSVLENDEGFWNMRTRSATIRLNVALAKSLVEKGLLKNGKELPIQGKIIIRESFEPFYDGQQEKINPSTGEVILYMNRPIYRQSIFTSNMNDKDMFIKEYWISELSEKANKQAAKETVPFEKLMEEEFAF